MNYILLVSDQHDPYYNLALEDWLLRHFVGQQPIIFMYLNNPCVVVGRAQNPWKECHVTYCQQHGIEIIRRQSGGGTVYHDLGNLNISFICPIVYYNRQYHLDLIVSTLRSIGCVVNKNKRHDLILHRQGKDYKVSGSAFRESKDKAFHHLTLLLQADLSEVAQTLRSPLHFTINKGVSSVRSAVANLNLQQSQVIKALKQYLSTTSVTLQVINPDYHYINQKQQEYRSWEWRFGKTLAFTIKYEGHNISVNHGIIIQSDHPNYLIGERF